MPARPRRGGPCVLLVPGTQIEVAVEYKNVKNINLRLLPPNGAARLSAPRGAGAEVLLRFLAEKRGWIEKKQAEFAKNRALPGLPTPASPRLLLWGKTLPVRFAAAGKSRARLEGGGAAFYVNGPAGEAVCAALYLALCQEELLRALPEESARAEGVVGKRAAGYRLKNMRSRWGSCNTQTGVVALNLQLARLPAFCLHYVLVHELAHLILPGHGPEFWKLMDGFCPDWRAARELMRHFPLF